MPAEPAQLVGIGAIRWDNQGMNSGDWLPTQAPFDLVRRGYSPEQVTAHLDRLEYDLRITTANRQETNHRLSEIGAQLAAAQAEADTLRSQLDRAALEPVSMSNLSDRMQRMIRLAEEEAAEIRARAEADADRLRTQLDTATAAAAQEKSAFDIERERTRKQLAEQVQGLIAEARNEADTTRVQARVGSAQLLQETKASTERDLAAATAEQERLDAAASAARKQEHDDFEISIAARRNDANRAITAETQQSKAAAQALVAEATARSEKMLADATAHSDNMVADATAHSEQLVADATAHSDQLVAGATSHADSTVAGARAHADKTVAEAGVESERLLSEATEKANAMVQDATAYSNDVVHRAAVDSAHRVAEADAAVGRLLALRSSVTEQLASLTGHLDHIRELAGSAPTLVEELPDEHHSRPRSADFPPDPAARPSSDRPAGPPDPEATVSAESPASANRAAGNPDGPHTGAADTGAGQSDDPTLVVAHSQRSDALPADASEDEIAQIPAQANHQSATARAATPLSDRPAPARAPAARALSSLRGLGGRDRHH